MPALDPGLIFAAALTLTFIFGSASVGKLKEMYVFRGVLNDYRLIPKPLVGIAAWFFACAEAVGALGVLWEQTRAEAATLLSILVVVFSAAVVVNIRRGRTHIDCGCFRNSSRQPIGWRIVLRNIALLFVAAICLCQPSGRDLLWIDIVSAMATAAALMLMYIAVPYTDLRLPAVRPIPDPSDSFDREG